MDIGFKRQIEPMIRAMVFQVRVEYPTAPPEQVADRVEPMLERKYAFPNEMPASEQERVRKKIRELIVNASGG